MVKTQSSPLGDYERFIFGGIAGCIAKTAVAPFDRVKIHFQIANPQFKDNFGSLRGVFYAIHKIYLEQGVRGLYQGHSLTLIRIFPYSAINFYAYDTLKAKLSNGFQKDFSQLPFYYRFPVGSMSGINFSRLKIIIVGLLSVALTYPLDLLRARMAYRFGKGARFTLGHELREFLSCRDGISKLYRGVTPTAHGMAIYSGTSFFIYETLGYHIRQNTKESWKQNALKFGSGFIAGVSAQVISYPLDVLRRRMQVYHIAPHLQGHEYSLIRMALGIYRTEGIAAFWRGLSVNFIKVAPATGISFYCYNAMKRYAEAR